VRQVGHLHEPDYDIEFHKPINCQSNTVIIWAKLHVPALTRSHLHTII